MSIFVRKDGSLGTKKFFNKLSVWNFTENELHSNRKQMPSEFFVIYKSIIMDLRRLNGPTGLPCTLYPF
jgi:hypothetical protein